MNLFWIFLDVCCADKIRYLLISDDVKWIKPCVTIMAHQFLSKMKTVTAYTPSHPCNSFSHRIIAQQLNQSGKNASTNTHHSHPINRCQHQQGTQQQYDMLENSKYMMFQTCSTEGTEPDQEGANKENMQMWSEPQQYTKRSNKRSPLKDITSKILTVSLKKDKNSQVNELNAYMSALFPTASTATCSYRTGKLLRI